MVTSVFSFILLVIEYLYTKMYGVNEYVNDFFKYKKQTNLIKAHLFLFFINIKYFLPIIIPPFFNSRGNKNKFLLYKLWINS